MPLLLLLSQAATGNVDAATILVDIQVSSAEQIQAVESATVYVDVQASGVEVQERTDSATAYVDVQPSGVDVHTVSPIDAATIYIDIQPSGIDVHTTTAVTVLIDYPVFPIQSIAQGSKEDVLAIITDRSGIITNLASSVPKFEVLDSAELFKYGNGTYAGAQAATGSGLIISCLVDTNLGGLWAIGQYRFFVWFVQGAEIVRKGPFYFQVVK
jgi:hypothetical protein